MEESLVLRFVLVRNVNVLPALATEQKTLVGQVNGRGVRG